MFKIRGTLEKKTTWIIGGASVGLVIVVWLILTVGGLVPPSTIPGPGHIAESVPEMHYEQYMVMQALVSLLRITLGFAAAAVIAVPLGILMGAYAPVRAAVQPLVGPLRFLPIAAALPIFIFWFGLGETTKIALLGVGTFVYLLPLIVETVQNVDDVYLKTAETLGATQGEVIWTILVPAALPAIFEAMRVMYGIGWTYVMLAEFVSTADTGFGYGGIGYLINRLQRVGELSDVLVCVALILLLGVMVDKLLAWTRGVLLPWTERN